MKFRNCLISTKILLFFISYLAFTMISCVEFAKNTSRDKLGHCIPKGEYGVIINKREYDFYGKGSETNYYITYQLSNGEECTDLITEYDYLAVNLQDTLTHDSARPFCEKNFGEPCNEALKSFLIGFIFFILIVGVPASLLWLIRKFLGSYIANSVIGRTWVLIRKIFTNIVEAKYGCFIYLLILLLAILLTGIVVWNTMIEVSMNNVSIIDFLKTM